MDLYGTHDLPNSDPEPVDVDAKQGQSQRLTIVGFIMIPTQFSLRDTYLPIYHSVRSYSKGITIPTGNRDHLGSIKIQDLDKTIRIVDRHSSVVDRIANSDSKKETTLRVGLTKSRVTGSARDGNGSFLFILPPTRPAKVKRVRVFWPPQGTPGASYTLCLVYIRLTCIMLLVKNVTHRPNQPICVRSWLSYYPHTLG